VLLELCCFNVQDPVELNKDFDEIFKMIVSKINLSMRSWY